MFLDGRVEKDGDVLIVRDGVEGEEEVGQRDEHGLVGEDFYVSGRRRLVHLFLVLDFVRYKRCGCFAVNKRSTSLVWVVGASECSAEAFAE